MNISRINLNLLVAFDVLLKECSVSRAAAKLHVTQAAMSNTLNQLRELFDDPLFIRQSKGLLPTEKASFLAPKVREALISVEHVFHGKEFNPLESHHHFTLVLADHGEQLILPKLYSLLEKKAPNIKISVLDYKTEEKHWLDFDNMVDLGIGYYRDISKYMNEEILFLDGAVCVGSKMNPIFSEKITLKKYLSAKHIATNPHPNSSLSFIDRLLKEKELNRNVVLSVPKITTALQIIEKSNLLGTYPEKLSNHLIKNYKVKIMPVPFSVEACKVKMVWHKRLENDAAHVWLRESIVNICGS